MGDAKAAVESISDAPQDRLVAGVKAADPAVCGQLYDLFGHRLHRYIAVRLPGDDQLAEELMLLTLAEAAQRIRSFNPRKATLSAWLYGVARRHVQRELRVRSRRKSVPASAQVPLEDMGEQAIQEDIADSVAARLQAQLTVMELRRCLSDIEMEVLILHCMHQLSAIEIGKVLGRSERAIDSLLRRARQKARERLAQDER